MKKMKFLKGPKLILSNLFTYRADKWLGVDVVKNNYNNIRNLAGDLVHEETTTIQDDFASSLKKYNVTEEDLYYRSKEFTRLFIAYLALSLAIFAYGLFLIFRRNFWGCFMCFGLCTYPLSIAFKYHFWLFQIKHKKLGCSLKEWWDSEEKS